MQRRFVPGGAAAALPGGRDQAAAAAGGHGQMQLTARRYHRVLKLGRTIAELEGEERVAPHHLAEALQNGAQSLIG